MVFVVVTADDIPDRLAWKCCPYTSDVGFRQAAAAVCFENDDEVAEFIEDPADNPEVTMQKQERGEILRSCLSELSPAHREIIDLVYYHERSIEEVSEIIGVPANTVKTRMFYARKRIGEMMAARGIERYAI